MGNNVFTNTYLYCQDELHTCKFGYVSEHISSPVTK